MNKLAELAERQKLIEEIIAEIPVYGFRRLNADTLDAILLRSSVREVLNRKLNP